MSAMEGLEGIGKRAYEKQLWGAYDEAIIMYTAAIRKYPDDSRLYNNRCLCYLELKDYAKAMNDADHMIKTFATNKKSYYRKGEILAKLKKYEEAEAYFRQVLNVDPKCEDARIQAREAQISQICEGTRYSRKQASRALNYTGNVEEAKMALVNGTVEARLRELENIIYVSDDDECTVIINNTPKEIDPLIDPSNPYQSLSLWVGCITRGVTEQNLHTLFSKFGRIKSVRIVVVDKMNGYAFVNFYDASSTGKAMKHMQGYLLEGQKIVIKYPDNVKAAAPSQKNKFK